VPVANTARKDDIHRLFHEDVFARRKARGGIAVGKKRPQVVVMPTTVEVRNLQRDPPWWQIAPTLVHVNVVTGEVLAWNIDWL